MLSKITNQLSLDLLCGLALLITSGYETITTLDQFAVGAHHGVLIFSIFHLLKTIREFIEGVKTVKKVVKTSQT